MTSGSSSAAGSQPHVRPFFEGWARFVIRRRFPLLFLTVMVTVAAVYQVKTKLQIQASLESFLSAGSEAHATLEAFRDTFGRDDVFLVMVEGDVFSIEFLERLLALHRELEAIELDDGPNDAETVAASPPAPGPDPPTTPAGIGAGDDDFGDFDDAWGEEGGQVDDAWAGESGGTQIDEVMSLVNARKFESSDGGLLVRDLLDPFPTAETVGQVRRDAYADPAIAKQLLDANGKFTLLAVRTVRMPEEDSDRIFRTIQGIMARHQTDGFHLGVAGPPALTAYLTRTMQRDLKVLFGSALLIMVLVLAFLFRHPLGVFGPILVIVMSVVWTFASMATVGAPMTLISNIIPAFLFAVGLGDAIHLISVYRDLRRDGESNERAIEIALGNTGMPLLFTSLTTAVGLLSFNLADVEPLAHMGTAAAAGVGFALLHSLVFLPIILSFNARSLLGARKVEGGDRLDRALGALTGVGAAAAGTLTRRRTVATVVIAGVLTGIAGWGVSRLDVSHNPLAWLPQDEEPSVTFRVLDRELGGSSSVQLLIETTGERGLKDLDFLRSLEALDRYLKAYEDPRFGRVVGESMSVLDIVRQTNQALHQGDEAFYRLPDTQREASDLLFLFESSRPDDMRRLSTADLRTTQMTVRLRWLDANSYVPLTDYIETGVEKHLAGHAKVGITGNMLTLASTVAGLIDNLLRSFGAALVVITLFMILLLREFRLGLVAMVPNLLPVVFIMGLMGLVGIPIDMANLMLASVAIGIAVDDTIHLLYHFKAVRSEGADTESALRAAVQHAGRAMAGTTLVLALGFSVFLTGSMSHLQRFGGLIALTAVVALLVDLIFCPALLRLTYRK